VQSARDQHGARTYIDHHLGRLPVVVVARVAREWDLYEPVQMAQVETHEGRPFDASLAGLGFYYALLPFAAAGIVILRRRHIDQWFLLVPAGVVTLVRAFVSALIRYRAPFEVCLVVLSAPAMVLVGEKIGHRIRLSSPTVGAKENTRRGLPSTTASRWAGGERAMVRSFAWPAP
jgi:hypothetical protein